LKIVLDTNVWLDLLVFDDPAARRLRSRELEILIDAACAAELERVLAYPLGKWSLAPERRAACFDECRRMARWVASDEPPQALPRCEDADDQKFIELAAAARADALVTRDEALLKLRGRVPFRIARPGEL
jgi:putative PIN family toxin of toxin-antitoxin system